MGVYRNKIGFKILFLTFIFLVTVLDGYGQSKCLSEEEVKKIIGGISSQQSAASNKIGFKILFLTFIFLVTVLDGYGQSKCLSEEEVKKIIGGISSQQSASFNKKLQLELLQIKQNTAQIYDELSRSTSEPKSFDERLKRQQAANGAQFCQILKEHGWTSKALVGAEAAEVPPVIFTDGLSLEFQQQLIPIMQAAFEAGEISKGNYAKIVDQLRVRSGKKQVFGTLVGISKDLLVLYPIENEAKLEELRREYELPPLADR